MGIDRIQFEMNGSNAALWGKTRWFAALAGVMLASACATAPGPETQAGAPGAPSRPAIDPGDLMGQSPATLDEILGKPALTRREGPGEYRRYALEACALIIILYPDEQGQSRVAHLDAAALRSGEENPAVEDCLAGAS